MMAAQTSMLHVRVDDETKIQATEALAAMGLSVSDAVRLFLRRVVAEQAVPFELKVPNDQTRLAINESRALMASRRARFKTPETLFDDFEKYRRKLTRGAPAILRLCQGFSQGQAASISLRTF
jgi:DNA-damage-inducible protein J